MQFLDEKILDKYKNKKILVLYGGISDERNISIETGKAVLNSLLDMGFCAEGIDFKFDNFDIFDEKKIDIVFIALHGKCGEDGKLQSFLELKHINYTGSDSLSSGIAMNKFLTKKLISSYNIPTAKFFKINSLDFDKCDEKYLNSIMLKNSLSFPVVVKPNNNGSAIGVNIVNDIKDLILAIKKVKKIDKEILIEKYIKGREFSVGIIGKMVLPVLEIKTVNAFYDYEAKYIDGKSNHFIPTDLDDKILENIKKISLNVSEVIGARGASRVDIIMEEDKIFVLEINTIPGMTKQSLLPYAAEKIGISFNELVLLILENIYER